MVAQACLSVLHSMHSAISHAVQNKLGKWPQTAAKVLVCILAPASAGCWISNLLQQGCTWVLMAPHPQPPIPVTNKMGWGEGGGEINHSTAPYNGIATFPPPSFLFCMQTDISTTAKLPPFLKCAKNK